MSDQELQSERNSIATREVYLFAGHAVGYVESETGIDLVLILNELKPRCASRTENLYEKGFNPFRQGQTPFRI